MKRRTRILSLLVTLALMISSLVIVPVTAEEATVPQTWEDITTVTELKKDDSGAYLISTPDELAYFAKTVTAGTTYATWTADNKSIASRETVKLTKDIDLAGYDWSSIGTNDKRFEGIFDGQGFSITNVTFSKNYDANNEATKYATNFAFFGKLYEARVMNLNLEIDITATTIYVSPPNRWCGGLATSIYSGTQVDTCNITINTPKTGVVIESADTIIYGGVGGYMQYSSTVKNTNVYGDIYFKTTAENRVATIGGFVGRANACNIINSNNYLNITFDQAKAIDSVPRIGGFYATHMADPGTTTTLTNCVNYGTLTVQNKANAPRVGGMVGNAGNGGNGKLIMKNCINLGKLVSTSSSNGNRGGLVGYYECTKDNSGITVEGSLVQGINPLGGYNTSAKPINGESLSNAPGGTGNLGVGIKVAGEEAIVSVSKSAWETITAASSLEGKVVYNGMSQANASSVDDAAYYFTFPAAEDATAALVLSDTTNNWSLSIDADPKAEWVNFAAFSFDFGTGTADDPFIIVNAPQLALMALRLNNRLNAGSHYALGADIDVSAFEWTPIQQNHSITKFVGTLDGYDYDNDINFTISGLTLTRDEYVYCQSMFGNVAGTAAIQNINLDDVTIEVAKSVKGTIRGVCPLVGAAYGGTISNVHVTNLSLTGNTVGDGYYGGLVGYTYSPTIENCSAEGIIDLNVPASTYNRVGGIVARGRIGTVSYCESYVDINVSYGLETDADSNVRMGGIVGSTESDNSSDLLTIEYCANYGDLTLDLQTAIKRVGVAGIVAAADLHDKPGTLVLDSCLNYGELTVTGAGAAEETPVMTAGIMGYSYYNDVTMTNCASFTTNNLVAHNYTETEIVPENSYAYDVEIGMLEQVMMRVDTADPANSGMQFNATISKALYDQLIADGFEVILGLVIAPTDILTEDYEGEDEAVAVEYKLAEYKEAGYGTDGFIAATDTTYYFGAALTGILEQNYGRDFSAYSFISFYHEEAELFYLAISEDCATASIAAVAQAALDNVGEQSDVYVNYVEEGIYSPYSSAQRDIISAFIPVA